MKVMKKLSLKEKHKPKALLKKIPKITGEISPKETMEIIAKEAREIIRKVRREIISKRTGGLSLNKNAIKIITLGTREIIPKGTCERLSIE